MRPDPKVPDQNNYVDAHRIVYGTTGRREDLGKRMVIHDLKTNQTTAGLIADGGNSSGHELSDAAFPTTGYNGREAPDDARYITRVYDWPQDPVLKKEAQYQAQRAFWNNPTQRNIVDMANRNRLDSDFSKEQQAYEAAHTPKAPVQASSPAKPSPAGRRQKR